MNEQLLAEKRQIMDEAKALQRSQEHELCEAWALWSVKKHRWGGPRESVANILSKMGARAKFSPFSVDDGYDEELNPQIFALNLAISMQPILIDRVAFEIFYVHRVRNIKAAACAMNISRQHFYRLVDSFRVRVVRAGKALCAEKQKSVT